jgi:hypothetical protein
MGDFERLLLALKAPQRYSYEALEDPEKQIRLLYLHAPTEGHAERVVEGSLVRLDHEDAPDYIAIFYTWGNEDATETLSLCACYGSQKHGGGCKSEGSLRITPNLETALRRISANSHHRRGRPVWVDAVCINQSDHNEKGHQVYKMDLIYRQAASVYIWLGEYEEECRLVKELIDLHAEICPKSGHDAFLDRVSNYEQHWRAVSMILSHPWFRLRWIIQEAALGPSKYFVMGGDGICWHGFTFAADTLQNNTMFEHDLGRYRADDDRYGMELLHALDMVQGTITRDLDVEDDTSIQANEDQSGEAVSTSVEKTLSLETLLELFSTALVSDTRDVIYSLIALAPKIDSEDWIPDYSPENTPAAVFMKALQHIIATNQDLDVICRSAIFRPGSSLPSFTSYKPAIQPLVCESCNYCGHRNRSLTTFGFPIWKGSTRIYRASGQMTPYCKVSAHCSHKSDERLQVEVPGYRIDVIREMDEGESELLTLHKDLKVRKTMLNMAQKNASASHHTQNNDYTSSGALKQNILDTFWRSLCGNRARDRESKESNCITEMPARWIDIMHTAYTTAMEKELVEGNEEDKDKSRDNEQRHEDLDADDVHEPEEPDQTEENDEAEDIEEVETDVNSIDKEQMDRTATAMSQGRVFALTSSSMGFVPNTAHAGMPIYILQGCSVPVVLRKCSDCHEPNTFNLEGDCYIDGVMEGELVDRLQRMVPEKITLH